MLGVTARNFAQEVEQISRSMPVVVDFWGENCAPCVALASVLERLEPEYAGRLRLVKLDAGAAENRSSRSGWVSGVCPRCSPLPAASLCVDR
jgi:thioredoxin-like negative regulator of GroEL